MICFRFGQKARPLNPPRGQSIHQTPWGLGWDPGNQDIPPEQVVMEEICRMDPLGHESKLGEQLRPQCCGAGRVATAVLLKKLG